MHANIKLRKTNSTNDPCCLRSGVAQVMAFRFFGICQIVCCLHQHLHCILTVLYDHVSDLLPDLPVCVHVHVCVCVYEHTNSKVKRVLDTSIMTRIVN